ncbi:hypothetical protein ACSBM8_11720 [Sphingomonas sp. ASY06-1R]|jgi:hypothetical protein|uniref:hypothetical protein n=1 Tax=Sphingomonas sp. ASY06-1R TaxID=3445771 RepID=UPI003FA24FE0
MLQREMPVGQGLFVSHQGRSALIRLLITILALALPITMTPAAPPPRAAQAFWLKHWRFGPMLGSPAARAAMKGVDAHYIDLRRDRIDHPLGDGVCTDRLDYSDLRHRTRAALAKDIGPFWRLPAAIERPGSVSGWIRCGGFNSAAVAFVHPRLGYLFFENGLVITLQ